MALNVGKFFVCGKTAITKQSTVVTARPRDCAFKNPRASLICSDRGAPTDPRSQKMMRACVSLQKQSVKSTLWLQLYTTQDLLNNIHANSYMLAEVRRNLEHW